MTKWLKLKLGNTLSGNDYDFYLEFCKKIFLIIFINNKWINLRR